MTPSTGYLLEQKSTCFKDLRWRFSFNDPSNTVATLLSALAESNAWTENVDILYPRLITYVSNDNHRVIIIPATGRIEIRIHYTTPASERIKAAHQLAESLATLLPI